MSASAAFSASLILCLLGGVLTLLVPRARLFVACAVLQSLLALLAAAAVLAGDAVALPLWDPASLGSMRLTLDGLGAVFVAVTAAVHLLASPVAAAAGGAAGARRAGAYLALYQVLVAVLLVLFAAGDVLSFLAAWEIASVLIFVLLALTNPGPSAHRPAYVLLALGELGAMAGLLGLLLLSGVAGGVDFALLRSTSPGAGAAVRTAAFLLTFFGFGVKAGLLPFNQWLPDAYAGAHRGFAPLLAGATTNLGIYAILRVNLDLAPAAGPGPGLVALVTGSATALVGILYATIQNDVRRVLAHSSIENMGIVAALGGAALVFSAAGQPVLAAMGLIAALYHTVNHSVFKTLLFVGAGEIERRAGSVDMDRLGGLLRYMPWTGLCFLVGVLSIAALPPLNGFVSEWLGLQTLLRAATLPSGAARIVFALAGAMLALTAGLAMTCFVKLFAMSFLGMPRSGAAAASGATRGGARAPMAALALLCVLLGVLPTAVVPVLDRAVAPLVHASAADALVPPFFAPEAVREGRLPAAFAEEFRDLGAELGRGAVPARGLVLLQRGGERNPVVFAMSTSYMVVVLGVLLLASGVIFRWVGRRRAIARAPAWDGGLRRLRSPLTYTATGFSNPVRVVFHSLLRPTTVEDTTRAVAEHFRTAVRRERVEVHLVERLVLQPAVAATTRAASLLRRMHVGAVNAYAAYVLLVLLAVIAAGILLQAGAPA